jgi:hypothetical protein
MMELSLGVSQRAEQYPNREMARVWLARYFPRAPRHLAQFDNARLAHLADREPTPELSQPRRRPDPACTVG